MKTEERIEDIFNTGLFNETELKELEGSICYTAFKSIEFYQLFHFTNEELYYLNEEEEENFTGFADLIEDTEKGRIYCFK